ncbi:conserved hypothetical protein [Leishmania major strain Friedlin]|uniref:non-specific serine/threonine protein kinase n=1 Tax=Leishmania major TaxID=5664 RepID=Q4QCC1_LEIMA|nr:conserved hypothetical protein [Leishmania major strain Friedlin]CAG9573417.1 Protein_kinase_domain/Protein_tyrosine_kinase/Kinase-like_-_putative [Leishmania major strain Friedlin]CAJ04334.1 conserved hypothetical protein [Leishmania major strain Friedlin]|eukprot:XP_001683027.1 conserved hypothetical protein [Leishmania major strain Friedlin]
MLNDLPRWPRYRPIRVIGQGGFGTVYLCVDTEPASPMYEQEVAVKAVSLGALCDEEVLMVMSEVSLLKNVGHPNIITYYDSFLYDDDESALSRKGGATLVPQADGDDIAAAGAGFRSQWLCLVTEYMDGGDLAALLRQYSGQGLSSTKGVCEATSLRTLDTAAAARKRGRPSAAVTDGAAAGADQGEASEGDWVSRSRLHRQRLVTTLRAAPRPPMSTSATTATKATVMRWDGLNASADQTWMSDASAAAMPTTPLGATDVEAADGAARGSRNGIQMHTAAASNAAVGSAATGAPHLASVPLEPQLPPLPNQLWVESFLITDIAKQCLDALAYLHALCIVHRDIKPSNIYLSKRDGTVKIGDFGVSKLLQSAEPFTLTFVGTPFYLCPELCMGDPYSFGADIWALGVVLYELYCLKLPFTSDNVLAQIYVITEGKYDTAALSTPHAFAESQQAVLETLYGPSFLRSERLLHSLVVSMVGKMLQVDPAERPSAEELLAGVFGAGSASRCGSSAGLPLAPVAPTPVHRPRSTCVLAHGSVSTPPQRGPSSPAAEPEGVVAATSQAPSNRLGLSASEQHARWAGSLVAAASSALQQEQGASRVSLTAPGSRRSRERRDDVVNDFTGAHTPLAVRVKTSVGDILQGMPSAQRARLGSRAAAEERDEKEEVLRAMLPVTSPKSTPSSVLFHSTMEAGVGSNSANRQTALSPSLAGRGRAEVSALSEKRRGSTAGAEPPSLELAEYPALQLLPAAPFPLELLYGSLANTGDSAVNSTGTTGEQRTVGDKASVSSPLGVQATQQASPLSSMSSADRPPIGRTHCDDDDALDHPIGAQTRSEIMALMENIPWLKNAEVFSAIPLSAGCDDVMLVERAHRSSVSASGTDGALSSATDNAATGGSEEKAAGAAPASKGSRTAPHQRQSQLPSPLRSPHSPATGTEDMQMSSDPRLPVCRAGVVSPTAPRIEVKTISGTTITMGDSRRPLSSRSPFQQGSAGAAEMAEAESTQSVSQRRISGGFTAASRQPPCIPAAPLRQRVSVTALSTTVLTSTPTPPASRPDKPQMAQDASGPARPSPSLQPRGNADRQPTAVTAASKGASASYPRLFSSSSLEPTVGNAASEARLRPFSAARMLATAMASASGAAPPTPKAHSPGHCEGYSTTELEALLQAKLLTHCQRRQRQLGAQWTQRAAREAAKAATRAKLKALYDEAFVSRLAPASSDAAYTATYHSGGTIDGPSEVPDEFVAHADERSRAASDSGDSGAHFPGDDALATPVARAPTQLPALEADAWAKGAPVAAHSAKEVASPTPPPVPSSHGSSLPFSVDATARQAETEESVLRALSAVYPRPVEIPATTVPGTGMLMDDGDDSKGWLAATPSARRIREAASLAVAVEHQCAAFRRGKEPARLRVVPPWRPPHDSRDVPGLWETSSAEEEADASARGRLGRPAPTRVREEVRWRWSAPPSDLDDTAGTTSEDEERGALLSSTASSSAASSMSTSPSSSSALLASTSGADTLDAPGHPSKTPSITAAPGADVQQRLPSPKLVGSGGELGGGVIGSRRSPDDAHAGEPRPSSLLGSPMYVELDSVDGGVRGGHARGDGMHRVSLSTSSLADASAKATAAAGHEKDETDSASASRFSTPSSTSSALRSSASRSSGALGHPHRSKDEARHDVSSSSHDEGSSAENSSSGSSSDDAPFSASQTASFSFHSFGGAASSTDTDGDDAEPRAAAKRAESDGDEDMSYTYTVQLDAVTGLRHFEYVCPVTVEVVGALPGGCRVVSAVAASHALDAATAASLSATQVPPSEHCSMKQGNDGLATRVLAAEAPTDVSATPRPHEGSDDTAAANGGISSCLGQDKASLFGGGYYIMWQEDGGFDAAAASPPTSSAPAPSSSLSSSPPGTGVTVGFTAVPAKQQGHLPAANGMAPPEGFQSARAATLHSAPPSTTNWQPDVTVRVAAASSSCGKDDNNAGSGATAHLRGRTASLHLSGAPLARVAAPLRPSHVALAVLSEEATAKAHTPLTRSSLADSNPTKVDTEVLPASKSASTNADGNPAMDFLCDRAWTRGQTAATPAQEIAAVMETTWWVRVPSSPSAPSQGLETPQQQHQLAGSPQYIRLPLSLALRPLRQRTRFVGLLWRLWVSLQVSEPALSRVLLHRRGGAPSPSPGCTFAEAFGDWVTGTTPARNTDTGECTEEDVSPQSSSEASSSLRLGRTIITTATTGSSSNSDTAADSQVLPASASLTVPSRSSPRKWGLYYVEARTWCAVQLRTDADWAVVRRKVAEMGTMLPFVRLYLLLEEAERASE